MKSLNHFAWIVPLILLTAGCAAPVASDHTIAEWQRNGMLPPTGSESTRVYEAPQTYPTAQPSIIVQTDRGATAAGDLAMADSIRQQLEYDRRLAPSLQDVTIQVRDGRITLSGVVRSDLDQRLIVDNIRDVAGVTRITDDLQIDPNLD